MEILIIGAGPGGYETALEAARRGWKVTLVEGGHVGGVCLNEGCIPTKAYCRSAEIVEEIRACGEFGISAGECRVDFASVKARKDRIVAELRGNVEALLEASGVRLVRGMARFRDAGTVLVGDDAYTADFIVIATGSRPSMLPLPGMDLPGVVDSAGLLALDSLPARLCIIGGGVIGLEFASVFRSFGSDVTVVEYCREVLPNFDHDIAKRLRQSLSKRGVKFSLGSGVIAVEEADEVPGTPPASRPLEVKWLRKGVMESCMADKVLVAAGRKPDCSRLCVDAAGIATDRGAIVVDSCMRTSVPDIFAIGDVTGGQMLAHAAVHQGKTALEAISAGDVSRTSSPLIPSAVFTMPEAAAVGLTEDACRDKGIPFRTFKSFFRNNGKAVCLGQTDGLCKIVAGQDGDILGCHVLGPHASALVQEVSVLMSAGAGIEELAHAVHIHPTLGEVLQSGL